MRTAQVSSIIQCDREQLLHIRSLVDSTFSPWTTNNREYPWVRVPVAVPGKCRRRRKRGSRIRVWTAVRLYYCSWRFNNGNLRKVLPRYHQHISCLTHGVNTLDHVHTPFQDGYKALPQPPFGKSDHVSVLFLRSYRQKLKQDRSVTWTNQRWSDQSDSTLCHYFSATQWCVFQDNNINTYTDTVMGYIGKCIDDFVSRITVLTFPNQKSGSPCQTSSTVIWRSTGSPGMHSGELLAVLRDNIGTKWSLTTRTPTPETCGLD